MFIENNNGGKINFYLHLSLKKLNAHKSSFENSTISFNGEKSYWDSLDVVNTSRDSPKPDANVTQPTAGCNHCVPVAAANRFVLLEGGNIEKHR